MVRVMVLEVLVTLIPGLLPPKTFIVLFNSTPLIRQCETSEKWVVTVIFVPALTWPLWAFVYPPPLKVQSTQSTW